ncbi:hypothetical protein H074_13802 [Amycolatopsis decaplanina DSM 44594]|uniref:Uncharacterized protein n=1 Tax=Amycolatopsis decaplanina DSM 44594 TaxID=1284240 RepID=M2XGM3_9PSEU|nr:hypothetical protein H074_13802 [Amycolatopsis decaplanina DSM 44594]
MAILHGLGVTVGWNRERVTVDAAGVHLDIPLVNCAEARLGHVTTPEDEVQARLTFRWAAAAHGEPSGEVVLHFPASIWDDLVVLTGSITAASPASPGVVRRAVPGARVNPGRESVRDKSRPVVNEVLSDALQMLWESPVSPLNGGAPASPGRRRPDRPEKPLLPQLDFARIPGTPDWVGFRSLGHGGFPGPPD